MSEQASKLMDEDDDLRIKIGSYCKVKIYNKCLLKLFWLTILKFNIEVQLGELILDRVPSFFTSFYLFHHLALGHITYLQAKKKSDTIEAWGAWGARCAKMGNGSYRDRGSLGQFTNQLFPLVTFLQFEKLKPRDWSVRWEKSLFLPPPGATEMVYDMRQPNVQGD